MEPLLSGVAASKKIVLVDDDPAGLIFGKGVLKSIGLEASAFQDPLDAWNYIEKNRPDLVITDWQMPGLTGMDLMFRTRALPFPPHVIITTGYGTVDDAVQFMSEGAYYFLAKPIRVEHFAALVNQCLRERMISDVTSELHPGRSRKSDEVIDAHVSRSPLIRRVFDVSRSAASTDTSVLLLGETGTGKEVLADFIHKNSSRSAGPLIKVNCGALPEHLMESELFGHEKGAFTGADRRRIGRFEAAQSGTIFLDEIGDLLQSLQVKLLRVLQQRAIERVGGSTQIPVDFRLICATHRDLDAAVAAGTFREDLLYRINVMPIIVPPLRDRREDIEPLALLFLESRRPFSRAATRGFTPEAMKLLTSFDFPGNIRQLENAVEFALVVCREEWITPDHLPERIRRHSRIHPDPMPSSSSPANLALKTRVQQTEEDTIREALLRRNWCIAAVARDLKMSRTALYQRLKLYKFQRQ